MEYMKMIWSIVMAAIGGTGGRRSSCVVTYIHNIDWSPVLHLHSWMFVTMSIHVSTTVTKFLFWKLEVGVMELGGLTGSNSWDCCTTWCAQLWYCFGWNWVFRLMLARSLCTLHSVNNTVLHSQYWLISCSSSSQLNVCHNVNSCVHHCDKIPILEIGSRNYGAGWIGWLQLLRLLHDMVCAIVVVFWLKLGV